MDTIAEFFRQKDVDRLFNFITSNALFKNWLVQGMPGGGIDYVFQKLSSRLWNFALNQSKIKIINIDFASLWTAPLSHSLFQRFIKPLQNDLENPETLELTPLIDCLRSSIKSLSEEGWQFVYIFNHFDSVLKFNNPEDIQELLNTFQSLCYESSYRTSNIVECYRDIEDICRHTNYSDYYKVFGTNHTRISRIATPLLEQEIKNYYPNFGDISAKAVVELCGGFPELADLILRDSENEGNLLEKYNTQTVFSAAFPFDRWIDSLSHDELIVLDRVSRKRPLEKDFSFYYRKLLRKELIKENQNGEINFVSPLFEHYLTLERIPAKNSGNKVTIRRVGLLDSLQKQLLEDLFSERFIVELTLQQDLLPGNASVFMVTGEDEKGLPYRPCIVKLDESSRSERENKNLEMARRMLGAIVPSILKRTHLRGQDAVILEYATADNKNYSVMQFAQFYQSQDRSEVIKLIEKVFVNALAPFYRSQKVMQKDAKSLYFLPRLHHGEYDTLSSIARRSKYCQSNKIQLDWMQNALPNPGEYLKPPLDKNASVSSHYERLFVRKRKVGLSIVHGDLNPRNLLVDGIGNIHIIDFSELKEEGARFLDFARLESEIKFKLASLSKDNLRENLALECMMINADDLDALKVICLLPLSDESRKMASSIFTLRKAALSICNGAINFRDFNLEYLLGLLTQTLRIALFQDYISDVQQEFAIISAALIIDKIEKLEI